MAFKLTYATMFNPPEELHVGFDGAVAKLKQNLGKEYSMIINGKDVFADDKWDDHSPVNTDWVLGSYAKRFCRSRSTGHCSGAQCLLQSGVVHLGRNV